MRKGWRHVAWPIGLAAFAIAASPQPAGAHAATVQRPTQGSLVIASDDGGPARELPLKKTAVTAYVAGFVAQVKVQQTFNNPFDDPLEAIYVFPLPENAAVSDMKIRIGERTIRGTIKKREEARQAYEDARRQGKTAALLDQERPNVFTQSVANIPPKKEVFVEIVYDVQLRYEDGKYEFVYPMVVGPRYIPGKPNGKPTRGEGTAPDTDQVPDASRITPPPVPAGKRSGRNVSIDVTIDPGTKIQDIESPTHSIDVEHKQTSTIVNISLARAKEIPNKDFVIRYSLASKKPAMSVLAHRGSEQSGGYFAMLFEPPARINAKDISSKELYFVVDTSGSMSGEPLQIVRRAMRHAIRNLNPDDTFQIIRFSASASQLGSEPLANTPENVERAIRYINKLDAGGGTEMLRGVRAALDEGRSEGRLRIVCLMTDGYVGNETAILTEVQDTLGPDTRLFAFGIGSSVNRYLLEAMTDVGRGSAHYMLLAEPPEVQIETFYHRIKTPVLTHVEIDWGELDVTDQSPAKVPDLFSGQPLSVVGRLGKVSRGTVTVRGKVAGRSVSYKVPVTFASEEGQEVLSRLWARSRIRELSREQLKSSDPKLVEQITQLGLDHRLMTRYTSFVAIDQEKTVDGGYRTYVVPVEVPDGVDRNTVFSEGSVDGKLSVADAEEDSYRASETVELAGSSAVRRRLVLGGSGVRLGLSLGAGITTLGGADDSRLAGALSLRVDRFVGASWAVGGQSVLLLSRVDDSPVVFNLLAQAAYLRLLRGWLNLVGGVGPSISTDGDLGLGVLGAIELRTPSPFGLQLRVDGVVGPEQTEAATFTLGVDVAF